MEVQKIKIVFLLRTMELRAGIQRVITNLCNFIDTDKYEIYIYSFTNAPIPDDWIYNNRIIFLQQSSFPFEIKGKIPRISIRSYRTFIRTMLEIKPQIVHSHFDYYFTLLPYFLSRKIQAKFFLTIHTNSAYYKSKRFLDNIFMKLESFAIKKAKMTVIPVSHDMMGYLSNSNLKIDKSYFKVIQNGIDEEYFNKKNIIPADLSEYGIDNKTKILINLGRLEPVKNQEVIIRAMSEVIKTHPETKLLCLGNLGDNYNYYISLVNELKLENHVLFLGEKTNVASFLAAAHVGIFPSLSEGLSNALLEMMSMELPVILSDIPSFHEVTEGLKYPFFIQINDSNKLADYIVNLLNDEKLCKEIGLICRNQVINKFTARTQALNHMNLYNS